VLFRTDFHLSCYDSKYVAGSVDGVEHSICSGPVKAELDTLSASNGISVSYPWFGGECSFGIYSQAGHRTLAPLLTPHTPLLLHYCSPQGITVWDAGALGEYAYPVS
jgi:hypothetical protein